MAAQRFDQTDSLLLIEAAPDSLAQVRSLWPEVRCFRLDLEQADAAPDLVSREGISLVFCDLGGEARANLGILRKVRRVHPHLPVLATISEQDFDLALTVFRTGADDLLVAPLAEAELTAAVDRALARGRAQEALLAAQAAAERSLDDLVLLRTVGETTSREEDLQQLLDRIVVSIQSALEVEIVSVMLADAAGVLEIHAASGLPDEVRARTRIPAGEGIAGHVLQAGEAVLINDLATDGRFAPREDAGRYRTGSLLSVPIRYQERVLGVLNVNNKRNGEGFSGHDQDLLTTIAHQTALAIENLALVGSLRKQTLELEQAHGRLLKLHQGRTRFVCSLSHELKTPLTSVLGFADLLLNFHDQIEAPRVREYLEALHAEALGLQHLLTGMLRLFALDSGSENWHWEEVDLAAAVDAVLADAQTRLLAKDLELAFGLADDLMPVWADNEKIRLMLNCLVDNAIKFNRPGGLLTIGAENRSIDERPMVYLRIANQGESVPPEAAGEVFEAYAQLGDLDSGKPSGVGIGLATCRAILRQLHGRIFLEDDDPEGTCFGVLLPTRSAFEELHDDPTAY